MIHLIKLTVLEPDDGFHFCQGNLRPSQASARKEQWVREGR